MNKPLRYQQVAHLIESQIRTGTLRAGMRAPSLRSLAGTAGVSVSTVSQAYQQLEQRGLLMARPRSGYFVATPLPATAAVPQSVVVRGRKARSVTGEAMDALLESMHRSDVLALGSAATRFSGRLNAVLNRLTRQILREEPQLPNRLSPPQGEERLRLAVAHRLSRYGSPVDPDSVVVTAGTMEAIALSLGVLCREGDTVLVESPTYFGVLQVIEYLHLKVLEVPNRPGAGIDIPAVTDLLAAQTIQAAILMPNFNNPTGALTSEPDKVRLVDLFAQAGVPVIEDDIYGDLHLGEDRPRPLASLRARESGSAGIVTCGSVSKTIAMGYRIGWAVSAELSPDIARAKFCTSLACPALLQRVLARFLETGGYDRYLRQLREQLIVDRDRYRDAIIRHFPEGTRVSNPEGGVVLWVQLPETVDSMDLFRHALAEKIGIAPGLIFSAKGDYRNYVRLTMGAGWDGHIEDALHRLGKLLVSRKPER
ncbi:MAG: PLP-dependent aminotransferase family protein [Pseudomonadales bacterium]